VSTVFIRFSAHGLDAPRRSPVLERLLLRAAPTVPAADWRSVAFQGLAPGVDVPPVAGAALGAAGGAPGEWSCIASPVHCVAGMTSVTLPRDGCLTLNREETAALAADFNRTFAGGGSRLIDGRAGVLVCRFEQALEVETRDPEGVAGSDVFGCLPTGRDGPRLRRLMSEMEMWLFEHRINRARGARGLPPVTGLWLWGAGAVPAVPPVGSGWSAGRDPLFAAFGDAQSLPSPPGAGVLVSDDTPGSATWPEVERRWLAPAAAALASGALDRLELCAGARLVRVTGGWNWRVWRRPRPWWEYFVD
jgi:hypothetical protein